MRPETAEKPVADTLVRSERPVVLAGAGPLTPDDLQLASGVSDVFVAADGGADRLIEAGIAPNAVIGDLDSLSPEACADLPENVLYPVAEQDSTDFEKCLTRIEAPLVLAFGFSGGRMDHLLAAFNGLVRYPQKRCLLIGREDIALLLPPRLDLQLDPGITVSLFPMAECRAGSAGLNWPVDGLPFRPDGQIGTSNHAVGPVHLSVSAPKMLLLLPRDCLSALSAGLEEAPGW